MRREVHHIEGCADCAGELVHKSHISFQAYFNSMFNSSVTLTVADTEQS